MSFHCSHTNFLILMASKYNNPQLLQECLTNTSNINQTNFYGQTLLFDAVKSNNFTLVKTLIQQYGADINTIDIFGSTPLAYALPQSETFTFLSNKNATLLQNSPRGMSKCQNQMAYNRSFVITSKNVNSIDKRRFTPLLWAILYNHEDYFKRCLEHSHVELSRKRSKIQLNPVMLCSLNGSLSMLEELLTRDSSPLTELDDFGNSCLTYSCMRNDLSFLELLVKHGADVNLSCEQKGKPPLVFLTFFNISSAEILKTLLINYKAEVNKSDGEGNTALCYAAFHGNTEFCRILLQNGAELDFCSKKSKTPLSWAVTGNQLETVKFFIKEYNTNVNQIDYQGATALSYALKYENRKIIAFLKAEGARKPDPLSISIRIKDLEMFKEALGSDLDSIRRETRTTPLCHVIKEENLEFVKFLIENGADCCEKNKDGTSPLILAVRTKNFEIVKYLLDNGAKSTVHSALPEAIREGDLDIVELLLQYGAKPGKMYKKRESALLLAINLRKKELIEVLLKNGASPNAEERVEVSPLRKAVELEYLDIVKFLIENGANVCEKPDNEKSLLQLAVEKKSFELVKLLVESNKNIINMKNEFASPLRVAIELDCFRIVKFLLENEAEVKEESLLLLAIHKRRSQVIIGLIEKGADAGNALKELQEFAREDEDFEEYFSEHFHQELLIMEKSRANKYEWKEDDDNDDGFISSKKSKLEIFF